ncbi:MAG: tetratricopeptide repeat protein [Candidatus Tenebribacter davisii]|jgi:tetratricopeptide (TPR) repeat protein|nr:tetratricopeptide repeat protein [Candidatus Tenebribacter davisii]
MEDQKKLNNILWQAKMHLNTNWLEAMRILQEGLKRFPRNTELLLYLAELYFNKKLFRKAIKIYHHIMEIEADNETAIFQIANSFLAINEYKLAIDYYDRLFANFPELLYNKAYAYSKIGRHDKSIEALETAFNFNISSLLPYIFLAELYFLEGRHEDTLKTLEKAQLKFGSHGNISYLKGLAYFNLKNYLKAYIEFENADKLKVNSANFYKNFALTCNQIGKTEKAINLLLKCIKSNPFDPIGYIELIDIYMAKDRNEEAFAIVKLAKKNIPLSVTLSMLYDKLSTDFIDKNNKGK